MFYREIVTKESAEEIGLFTEQARWLFEYHDGRSESLCTRAVALIGFVGVILALLLSAGLPGGVKVTWPIKLLFVVTLSMLLLTSACCLATLMTRELNVPGVEQLRENWHDWIVGSRRGSAAKDVTETFLTAKSLDARSALDWVRHTASARAVWFGRAVVFMALSLLSLTGMVAVVGVQLYL